MDSTETLIFDEPDFPASPAGPEVHRLVMGRYRLVRRLGAGGFGVVWEARDEQLDRLVAVKTVAVSSAEVAARAGREAQAAARLSHPGIVALYESSAEPGAVHLVSELVQGSTLGELLADERLSDREIVRIGVALCDALDHAHSRGVVHRDLKPANVMVPDAAESEPAIAKLTDFGVARVAGDQTITRNGDVVGTFSYMAPEQAEGREATPASDLYSLALVLYEALAGTNPVRGTNPAETARNVGMELPSLEEWRPDLPPELCEAVDRAACPDPAFRGTVAGLREELELCLEETSPDVMPPPPAWAGEPAPAPLAPPVARRPASAGERALAAVAGAAVAAACIVALPAGSALEGRAAIAAALAAVACGLLPRVGTLLTVGALLAVLVACGVAGWAVLLLAAFLPGLLLMPREGFLWLVPAAAPLLGLAGVALAFVALAGQAAGGARRAILAALGLWWLVLAEPVAGGTLLIGDPAGLAAPGLWQGSVPAAITDVLVPVVAGGSLLVAVVWALAALVLPMLPAGHRSIADLVVIAAWAAGLAAGTALVVGSLLGGVQGPSLRGLLAGAAVAALVALVGVAARSRA